MLSSLKTFQKHWRKQIQHACYIRNKSKESDFGFVHAVIQKKAGVEDACYKLTGNIIQYSGEQHPAAALGIRVAEIVNGVQVTVLPTLL